MPIPLLAFLGLGLGTKYGLDKYNQARANQQAGENFKRAQGFIGAPGQPLNTGVGPLLQGSTPGMSQATGMFSPNQAERAQSAVGLMSTPGYAPMGAQLMTDIARNRAAALKARSLAPLFAQQMQPAVQQFLELAAQNIFANYGKPPTATGPFQSTGVQATALNR